MFTLIIEFIKIFIKGENMKRLFLLSFILLLFSNTAYSAQNENANISNSTEYTTIKKKDPKIFDKYIIKETDKTKYQQKISADNKKYSSIKNQLNNDQYNLYRIFEQIIRANNLEYQNWRIGIKRTATNVNASAGSANLILINSALYDSIYNDKDAVAFVLSHEMAHFLLNHTNKSAKIIYNIDKLEHKLKGLKYYAKSSSSKNELIYLSSISTLNIKLNRLYKKLREMELEADKEAISIMARAGYNPDNAVSVIEFFEKLPNIDTAKSSHPDNLERINNNSKEISLIDKESLKNQGQANIFNSDVVSIKKSTDKYTFVMHKKN